MSHNLRALLAAVILFLSGCGYTTQSMLPEHLKTVHVYPVRNAIDITNEISRRSETDRYQVYRPGIEVDVTNAIIDRFILDGTLRIATPDKADTAVEAKLTEYRRDVLRYSDSDDIQEYRISVVVDVTVIDKIKNKVLWRDNGLTGDTSFFLAGGRAVSEEQATKRAVEDVARRVVEKTIELW